MKQIIFLDEKKQFQAGFLLDSGEIICACCGSVYPIDKQENIQILHIYDNWINLKKAMLLARC